MEVLCIRRQLIAEQSKYVFISLFLLRYVQRRSLMKFTWYSDEEIVFSHHFQARLLAQCVMR
jgi:hypothetical protein